LQYQHNLYIAEKYI